MRAIVPRTASVVRLTCGNFQARSVLAVRSKLRAGGKWSEECPWRDIFYMLAQHCSRCCLFRINTFRNCGLKTGQSSRSAIIYIHSDQKWPERIVYDTSLPTVVPAQITNIEANVAAPEIVASTAKREAFAQLQPSSQLSDAKKIEPKLQRHHKIATRRAAPPALFAGRQMQFGWFGNRIW